MSEFKIRTYNLCPYPVFSGSDKFGYSGRTVFCQLYFQFIRQATASWLKSLSLVSLLLLKACSKKKATRQKCAQVMDLTGTHINWWGGPIMTLAGHRFGPRDWSKSFCAQWHANNGTRHGGEVVTPMIGLGYIPSHLVKISVQLKDKESLAQ